MNQAYKDLNKRSISPSLDNRKRSSSKGGGDRPDSQLKKKMPQGFITNISIEREKFVRSPEKSIRSN